MVVVRPSRICLATNPVLGHGRLRANHKVDMYIYMHIQIPIHIHSRICLHTCSCHLCVTLSDMSPKRIQSTSSLAQATHAAGQLSRAEMRSQVGLAQAGNAWGGGAQASASKVMTDTVSRYAHDACFELRSAPDPPATIVASGSEASSGQGSHTSGGHIR